MLNIYDTLLPKNGLHFSFLLELLRCIFDERWVLLNAHYLVSTIQEENVLLEFKFIVNRHHNRAYLCD